jgi:four helix bundle protein
VRKALRLADQEARRCNQEYVGAEHLLLGLAKEGSGVAAGALRNLGVDAPRLHREIEKLAQSGPSVVIMGQLPNTPQVRDMLGYAMEEARLHHCPLADTGHVLLGLLGEAGGIVAQILGNLGLQLEEVRRGVLDLHAAGIQDMPGNLEALMAAEGEEDRSGFGPRPGSPEGPDESYRDLPLWQEADELTRQVYAVTAGFPQEPVWNVASELRKAAFGIAPAIAEAHRCRNKAVARWFLHGALAALADVQYLVLFSSRLGHLKDEDGRTVKSLAEGVDSALRRFCESLE